jgi:hypothetical protein
MYVHVRYVNEYYSSFFMLAQRKLQAWDLSFFIYFHFLSTLPLSQSASPGALSFYDFRDQKYRADKSKNLEVNILSKTGRRYFPLSSFVCRSRYENNLVGK